MIGAHYGRYQDALSKFSEAVRLRRAPISSYRSTMPPMSSGGLIAALRNVVALDVAEMIIVEIRLGCGADACFLAHGRAA